MPETWHRVRILLFKIRHFFQMLGALWLDGAPITRNSNKLVLCIISGQCQLKNSTIKDTGMLKIQDNLPWKLQDGSLVTLIKWWALTLKILRIWAYASREILLKRGPLKWIKLKVWNSNIKTEVTGHLCSNRGLKKQIKKFSIKMVVNIIKEARLIKLIIILLWGFMIHFWKRHLWIINLQIMEILCQY